MRIILVLLILTTLIFSGCETFKGFGRDVQNAGGWVEKTADRADKSDK